VVLEYHIEIIPYAPSSTLALFTKVFKFTPSQLTRWFEKVPAFSRPRPEHNLYFSQKI
jgi:hypothetical protein